MHRDQRVLWAPASDIDYQIMLICHQSVIRGLERGPFELIARPAAVESSIIRNHSGAEDASRLSSSTELRSSTLPARGHKSYASRGQGPRLIR